jgi:hypothetical protein
VAWREEHEEDCEYFLGKPFSEVHAYLDECARHYPVQVFGAKHRVYRHNAYGVEHCKWKWGDEGELAAKIHIVRDHYGFVQNMKLVRVIELADQLLY